MLSEHISCFDTVMYCKNYVFSIQSRVYENEVVMYCSALTLLVGRQEGHPADSNL